MTRATLSVAVILILLGINFFLISTSVRTTNAMLYALPLAYAPVSGYGDILIVPVTDLRSLEPGECQTIKFLVSAKPSFDGLSLFSGTMYMLRLILAPISLVYPLALPGDPVCNYRPDYPGCEGRVTDGTGGTTTDTTEQQEKVWEQVTGVVQPMRTVTLDIRGGLFGSGGSVSATPNTGCLDAEPIQVSVRAGEATYVNMQVCASAKCSFQPSGGMVMEATYTDSSGKTVSDAMMSPMGVCVGGVDTAVPNSGCNPHSICGNRAPPDGCLGVGNNGDDCHVTPDSVHCKCYESCLAHYESQQPFNPSTSSVVTEGPGGVTTVTTTRTTQCTTLVTTQTVTQGDGLILAPTATSPLTILAWVLQGLAAITTSTGVVIGVFSKVKGKLHL